VCVDINGGCIKYSNEYVDAEPEPEPEPEPETMSLKMILMKL
jgi:hypothetical protein